jgi:hypothetical protein
MKSILSYVGLLALTATAQAQTPTVIDITGSTAGRGATHTAILAVLSGETYAFDGTTTAGSATRAIYKGTAAGNTYTIRTYWAGSVNGVRDVARATQQTNFFATTVNGTAAGQNINPATPLASASAESAPEIGFSDVFQTSTEFTSPNLVVEDEVGIIPFKWFKNKDASANLTNLTNLQARALYGSLGELPLSIISGQAGDSGTIVYATGRNSDSGSRITMMAEAGYGVFNQVNQYTFTSSGGVITGSTFSGNNGYSSGGNYNVAVLGSTWASGIVVGYLGSSDWSGAAGAGAAELTWNGVPYSVPNVQNGAYTAWGYLHQNRMNLSGAALTFYNLLRDSLRANPGSVLIKDDATMLVKREGDGAPVFPKD